MKTHGAKSFKEIDQEYKSNSDYFKQLEYMKIEGTSEKLMPGLGSNKQLDAAKAIMLDE